MEKYRYGKIGHIKFIPMNKNSVFTETIFSSIDKNFNTLPIKNEKVDILTSSRIFL